MCCQGQEMPMTGMISPWAQQLGEQTAGMIGQGMQRGATPMPRDIYGAMMGAAQVPNFAYGPMQYLSQMYGGGQYQPMQFNPMDFYQSIYGQQPQTTPTVQPGRYATPA